MACSTGCPTQDHESWGACVRAKSLQIADVDAHVANVTTNRELNAYVDARKAGLQPAGTSAAKVRAAWKATDATGVAYRADKD